MRVYLRFLSIHLKSQMQYKASFVLLATGQLLVSFSAFLGVSFMMSRFHTVAGFDYAQVLLCFAVVLLAFSLAECFGRGFDMFPQMIGNGAFDRVLVRPRPPIMLVLCAQLELSRFGRVLQAVLMFAWAIPRSGVVWSLDKIITLIMMVVCGMVVFFALFILYAAFSFFTLEGLEFMNILTDGGREFGRYPFSAYGRGVLGFLTYIVPLALFQYYPLLYLLGRETSVLYMLVPLGGLWFLLPAYGLWRVGLSKYQSTGS